MKILSGMAVGLLVLSCGCDRRIKHGVEFIVAAATNETQQISANQLQRLVAALAGRMDALGYPAEVRALGEDRVSIKVPFTVVEHMGKGRSWLMRGGRLEMRLVHQESERLLREGLIPAGYTVMNETRVGPGGQQLVSLVVATARLPGLSGTNISQSFFTRGSMNDPQVGFQFDAAGRTAFANITATNVGRQIAIIMDGEVYSAPIIREPIMGGSGTISGGAMTEADAREVAVLLKHPMPVTVQIVEERVF